MTLTDIDRRTLGGFSRKWKLAPPCFSPNGACWDLRRRGLIEFELTAGERWWVRLTEKGATIMETAGTV